MNISEIPEEKSGKKFSLKLGKIRLGKLNMHSNFWVFAGIAVLAIIELYSAYTYLYMNLFPPDSAESAAPATRINFANYDKVTERLREVSAFRATSTIDFSGRDKNTGRANPFAEP